MNQRVACIRRGRRVVLATALLAGGFCATAMAQGFRGGDGRGFGSGGGFPSAEESFRRLDTDQNGQIDPAEFQQVESFRREFLTRMGIDGSRPISLREYTEKREQTMRNMDFSQFRRPDGGGGPPTFGGQPGGSPFGGSRPGESERREGSRSEESNRDSRRDDSRRDERGRDESRRDDRDRSASSSSSSGTSSKKTAKPKTRVTHDLPDDYRDKDKNGDGQIGLYEWDRKAFAQFYALDRNGDGLLTPDELIAAAKKTSSSSKTAKSDSSATIVASSADEPSDSISSSSTEAVKPSNSSSSKSASPSTETSAAVKSFVSLDRNNDGKLSEDEWQRSRTAREKFRKAGIEVALPIQQAQFVELYNKADTQ